MIEQILAIVDASSNLRNRRALTCLGRLGILFGTNGTRADSVLRNNDTVLLET